MDFAKCDGACHCRCANRRRSGASTGARRVSSKVVLVVGVFDLFHTGHVNLLRRSKELGDRLVIVVNGDALTSSYKRAPVMSEQDRLNVVSACRS